MPFPWKKAKGSRITQLVADRLQSPSHGGSLVVETGFPTSVVDLVIKNRDRLKKTHRKKKRSEPDPVRTPPRPSGSFEPPSVPITPASPSIERCSGYAPPQPHQSLTTRFPDTFVPVHDVNRRRDLVVDDRADGNDEDLEGKGLLMAILKVFLVVVLVLGTKTIAMGVTISVLSLLFMEYLGEHLPSLARPCADAKKSFGHFIEWVVGFVGISKNNLMVKEDKGFKAPIAEKRVFSRSSAFKQGPPSSNNAQFEEPNKMDGKFGEIQNLHPISNLESPAQEIEQEIQSLKYESGLSKGEGKLVHEDVGKKVLAIAKEEEDTGDVNVTGRRTKGGKMRSKIRKMMPKKLKKKRIESNSGADKANMHKDTEYPEDIWVRELDYDDNSSSLSIVTNNDQIVIENTTSESSMVRENIGKEKEEKISGGVMIFVIVLVGLLGSRALAFGLTLSWCLFLKSAGTLRRCMTKVPPVSDL